MRRAGLGEGAAGSNYGYTNSGYSVYEEENEKLTESLRSKVTAIKSLSIEIGTEVKQHNKLLTEMDNDFDSTSGFLGATMGRLKILSRGSQTKLLCYMMLFSLFVFFVIYWIIKLRSVDQYRAIACQQLGHTNKQSPICEMQAAHKTMHPLVHGKTSPRNRFLVPKRLGTSALGTCCNL